MATGERIKFFRNLRGMTQKYLGMKLGFKENAADVRIAQYESDTRKPKEQLLKGFAYVLDVSPNALTVPIISNHLDLMHTMFALEDLYGLQINKVDGQLCLTIANDDISTSNSISRMFKTWFEEAEKLNSGAITKEEYDTWRYNYPKYDTSRTWFKVPSKEISDMLVKDYRKKFPTG